MADAKEEAINKMSENFKIFHENIHLRKWLAH